MLRYRGRPGVPDRGVSGGGTPTSALSVFNQGVSNLLAGTSDLRILNIGDSTTIGISGAGIPTTPHEYKQAAATMSTYFPANEDAFWGFSTSGTLAGSRLIDDPRVVNGGGVNSSVGCIGGLTGRLSAVAANFVFTPDSVVDTFRVYWWVQNAPTISIQATGGTAFTATLNGSTGTQFGTTEFRYVDVIAASLTAGNAVTVTKTGGTGNFEVVGIEAWNSAAKRMVFTNCGHFGSNSANWATTNGGGRQPSDFLAKVPAGYYQLATIKAGINDAGWGVAIPTFKANIQIVINACKAGGMDVILESGNPRSDGTMPPYITALAELAAANNLFFVNSYDDPFIDYANALAQGWMTDGIHPSVSGFTQQKNVLTNLLIAQAGL